MDHTIQVIALVALCVGGAYGCSRAEERAMETEEIEASAGNEAALVGDDTDGMNGLVTPSDELEADAYAQ